MDILQSQNKSVLIVHPSFVEQAKEYFKATNLNIVSGQRFLGGFLRGGEDTEKCLEKKIIFLTRAISKVANAVMNFPQFALIAFTKYSQNELGWNEQNFRRTSFADMQALLD